MIYRGRVQSGVIVLAGDTRLPEGAEVRVDVVEPPGTQNGETAALFQHLKPIIGCQLMRRRIWLSITIIIYMACQSAYDQCVC